MSIENVGNTQINITKNGTTTLATEGKYCDRNIDVNVEVAGSVVNDADAILDGTFSGAYYSDKITSLRGNIFEDMKNVTSVSLPNCTVFTGSEHFYHAENLESIYLPNLTQMSSGEYIFAYTKIKEADLPNLTTIQKKFNNTFYYAELVEKINLPKLGGTALGGPVFYNARNLVALILGGDVLNPLTATNTFTGSGIAKGTGYVYVPDNLVDAYKAATNWTVYANQIKPISELEG
jgi:hypothetical protein